MNKFREMNQLLLTKDEFIVLDLETTGLAPYKGGRIIEIGAVRIKDDEIVEEYQQFIHPEQKLYKSTIELTGITNEMIQGMPVYGKVLPSFKKWIGNTTIVAHNAYFDWDTFLLYYFERVGIVPSNAVIDTLILAKHYFPTYKNHKLKTLCENENIDMGNHHRALDDAKSTAQLLMKWKKSHALTHDIQEEGLFSSFFQTDEPFLVESKQEHRQNENISSIVIQKIAYWEYQKTKKQKMQRIYVNTNQGSCYYDLISGCWYNKNMKGNIDFEKIQTLSMEKIKAKNFQEFESYRK